MIKSEARARVALKALDVFTRYFVTLETLMENHIKAREWSSHKKRALRCCWGSFLMCVVGRDGYEIILYPRLSSVQPSADSHVNLCNPNASSCCSQSRDLCPRVTFDLCCCAKSKIPFYVLVLFGVKIFMTMFIPRSGTSLVFVANTLSPVLEQWWVHVHLLFLWQPINEERGVK